MCFRVVWSVEDAVTLSVIANLDNLDSDRLCLQQVRDGSCLVFNLCH